MARKVFTSRIGVQRISAKLNPVQASYTRDIRAQMESIERNLSKLITGLKGVTTSILLEALTPTFAKSAVYCPKDTHRLVQSGYLEARERNNGVTVEIGYGRGGDPYYAVLVHERTDIPHRDPERSKFLQAALEEDSNAIPTRVQKGYMDAVGK